MVNAYDIAYAVAVGVSAPFWLAKPAARQKVRRAFAQRMGQVPARGEAGPAVMIHAVSLGEINATRGLVQRFRALRPDVRIIISATTDTGFARAQELYGAADANSGISVIRYPLDFTSAVARVLDLLRPSVVVLMELEVWPNFLLQCDKRGIPAVLVNGRITEPSFRRYRWGGPVVRRMFGRLAAVCAQEQVYADRFVELGATPDRVQVTGTMKFDTATVAARVEGDEELAKAVGLGEGSDGGREERHEGTEARRHEGEESDERTEAAGGASAHHSVLPSRGRVWVCGSTGPGEEEMVLAQYRRLLGEYPDLRLVVVPRKPERFDEVAGLITAAGFGLVRRSKPGSVTPGSEALPPVILGDTMGELRKFYSLADVVFVGRTLVDLGPRQHGSDMIEPAALAKPVIVGPFTNNFADAMSCFRRAQSIIEVQTAEQLGQQVKTMLASPQPAAAMGRRAQEAVRREKGATERHVQVILQYLPRTCGMRTDE